MAEHEAAPSKTRGWLKAILGTMGGVLSGAVVMYLTPLVNKAVAPAKPVANFEIDVNPDNLRVRFQNMSQGGQGWWEFGDGSPLEPVLPEVPYVYHTYPHPGEYTAKMTLHNILGDENERSAPVKLDHAPANESPRILALDVEPISRGSYAPATFRLRCQVQGAQTLIWDLGDDRDFEVADPAAGTEKNVTFSRPGGYVVKVAAVNGTQHDQKSEVITVMEPPADTLTAVLTARDHGNRVETRTHQVNFGVAFPLEHDDNVLAIERKAMARQGFTIKEARVQGPGGPEITLTGPGPLILDAEKLGVRNMRNLTLAFTQDRRTLALTGDLIRPATAGRNPDAQPSLMLPVQLVEQRELLAEQTEIPITTTLAVPSSSVGSSALLQIPSQPVGWVKVERKLRLELRQGTQVLWQEETALPHRVVLTLHDHRYLLTASQVNDHVHVDLREDTSAPQAAGK